MDTGAPFNARGVSVAFTPNGSTFSLSITPVGNSATTNLTDAYVGAGFAIDITANSAGNVYFNNLQIVPEPGTWAFLALGAVSALCVGVHRRHFVRA